VGNPDYQDGDGYPTEKALDLLRSMADINTALDWARELWHDGYGSISENITANEAGVVRADRDARYLRLATGGWSGNEAVLGALQHNRVVWLMAWQLSARGGLHIFKYLERR
jgi:hypothetical protein